MSNGKILDLATAELPSREVLQAAANLLDAIVQQYPRAAPQFMRSVRITVQSGQMKLEIAGGAEIPGLIVPPGSGVPL